jgi:aldehyde dehydrogenase (NAD+)
MAGSRIFVHESIYDAFLEKFVAKAKSLQIGDPFVSSSYYGPQASQAHFDRIMDHIQSGKDAGAKVIVGGDRKGNEGYFINSTIFTDTTPDMRIVREEIFGPVAVVAKFKDEDGTLVVCSIIRAGD